MSVKCSPFGPKPQFVDANGAPYSVAKLFFYASGSTTKQNTYTDSTGATGNTNPIMLDSSGRTPSELWFTEGLTYKAVLAPSTDTDPPTSPIFTINGLTGINDTTASADEWVASGSTPTYVSATSFTLPGDQTAAFHVGRRLKSTVTAGTIYSVISASSYNAGTLLTTVTVVNDSGALDSGLSGVSLGMLRANNSSFPALADSAVIVSGSSDRTKKMRFEVDGLTTATTRTLTIPDANIKLCGHATGFTANRIPVADGLTGGYLIDYTNFTYDGTNLGVPIVQAATVTATTSVACGTGTTTAAGLKTINGTAGAGSGYGAIYAENLIPSASNFAFAAHTDGTISFQNAVTTAYMSIGASPKITVTAGAGSTSGVQLNAYTTNGTVTTTGGTGVLSSASDAGLKVHDGYVQNPLQMLSGLKARYYYWKDDLATEAESLGNIPAQRQLGFFAQDVNASLGDEAANPPPRWNPTAPMGYYDRSVMAVCVEAIKELSGKYNALKSDFDAYKLAHP